MYKNFVHAFVIGFASLLGSCAVFFTRNPKPYLEANGAGLEANLAGLENFFSNFSFLILFLGMLFYWFQASNPEGQTKTEFVLVAKQGVENIKNKGVFSSTDRKTFSNNRKIGIILTIIANISLFLLLILRWLESGHFPLRNLYESLMFLSWNLTTIHLFIEFVFVAFGFPLMVFSALSKMPPPPPLLCSPLVCKAKKKTAPLPLRSKGGEGQGSKAKGEEGKKPKVLALHGGEAPQPPFGGEPKQRLSTSKLESSSINEATLQLKDKTSKLIGSIMSPCALFTNAFATFSLPKEMQEAAPLVPALQSNWLMMHVTVMILSYAALIFGSLLSMGFLVLTEFPFASLQSLHYPPLRRIRKHFQEVSKVTPLSPSMPLFKCQGKPVGKKKVILLPPPFQGACSARDSVALPITLLSSLERNATPCFASNKTSPLALQPRLGRGGSCALQVEGGQNQYKLNLARILDNLSYRVLGFGFPLLTIGILSGAVWANEAWGSYWSWDPKETWALLTWLVFAIYLHTRLTKGWEGKKPALIASLGFITVWICFLGVNLIGEGLHSYGWINI